MTAIRASSLPASVRAKANKLAEKDTRSRFLMLCDFRGLPAPEIEYQFALPDRKFALDIAWPDSRVAIEVEGGIWTRGAHGRGSGIARDMDKQNCAVVRHWRIIRVQPRDLCTEATIDLVKLAMQPVPMGNP